MGFPGLNTNRSESQSDSDSNFHKRVAEDLIAHDEVLGAEKPFPKTVERVSHFLGDVGFEQDRGNSESQGNLKTLTPAADSISERRIYTPFLKNSVRNLKGPGGSEADSDPAALTH